MSKRKSSRPTHRHPPARTNPTSAVSTIIIMVVLSSLCFIAIITDFYPKQAPPPSEAAPAAQNISKVISPYAFFYTKVFLDRHHTYITFPFKYDGSPLTTTLQLKAQAGNPVIERLIMHPLLYHLSWPKLTQDDLTLYQRHQKYSSVSNFLKSPPPASQMLLDDPVITLTNGQFKNVTQLTDDTTAIPESVNYILTSYKEPLEKNGWLYYETTLDASHAQPNNDDQLVWLFTVPQASQVHPFYLGEIHVDYRQQ